MKRALIHIDYTNDFVADDGKLTCGEVAQAIHDNILQLTETFYQAGDLIVFAIDTHYPNDTHHPEHTLFPPHNLIGTPGQNLYGELETFYQSIKQAPNVYYMPKTRYSAFAGTDLELKLRERGITELHLVGVCTDICILHTAVDAYNKGFQLVIHQNAVASFNAAGHAWALTHFEQTLGATLL